MCVCVCVNQRLFITNTGPPRGVYTCPHKVGYDVTLSLLVVYILTVPSPSPQLPPTPPPIHFAHLLPLSARPPQAPSPPPPSWATGHAPPSHLTRLEEMGSTCSERLGTDHVHRLGSGYAWGAGVFGQSWGRRGARRFPALATRDWPLA